MWVCSKCGCENEDSNKFCSKCGESIIDEASPAEEAPAAADGEVSPAATASPERGGEPPQAVEGFSPASGDAAEDPEEDAVKKDPSIFERVLAPFSIILGIIGLFSGGYAAIISFINIGTALLFFVPAAVAIIFGLLCLTIGANRGTKKVQILAVIGIVLGLIGIIAWLVVTLVLRSRVVAATGGTELIDAIILLLNK